MVAQLTMMGILAGEQSNEQEGTALWGDPGRDRLAAELEPDLALVDDATDPGWLSEEADQRAWELIMKHYDKIERLSRLMARGAVRPDDLLEDALLEMREQIHQFNPARGAFMQWARDRVRLSRTRQLRKIDRHEPAWWRMELGVEAGDEEAGDGRGTGLHVAPVAPGGYGNPSRMETQVELQALYEKASEGGKAAILIRAQGLSDTLIGVPEDVAGSVTPRALVNAELRSLCRTSARL